ncbi:MAG: glycosyltransferase family 2 protein [Deltaproteobacteria bacterium]|nr:glycosyltransferase family 2 protein [Deltaproteobacteria bacterium]
MSDVRICALVPTYDNPETIGAVVDRIRAWLPRVIVVDDGSGDAGRAACEALAREGRAQVVRHPLNRGKGAAVRTGLEAARAAGFSHAFQIDADGQHDLEAIPGFIATARARPEAAVLAHPVYEQTAPRSRTVGRELTRFWVDLEVGRGRVRDAMIGFRIYPIDATLALGTRCERMDFDVEVAVLLAWAGVPIENRPVGVRYLTAEEGGLSHFRLVRDNAALFRLHSRFCTQASMDWLFSWLRPRARARGAAGSTTATGAEGAR